MSEQESAENVTPNGEHVSEKNEVVSEVSVDDLAKRLKELESVNGRLLEESKVAKYKYRTLREEVASKEKEGLQESESWKELYEREQTEKHELRDNLSSLKKTTLRKELEAQVARRVPDAFDIDDVVRSLPKDHISIDDETLTVKGVDEAVSLVREKKPWMFKQERTSGQVSARPEGHNGNKERTPEDDAKEFRDSLHDFILN